MHAPVIKVVVDSSMIGERMVRIIKPLNIVVPAVMITAETKPACAHIGKTGALFIHEYRIMTNITDPRTNEVGIKKKNTIVPISPYSFSEKTIVICVPTATPYATQTQLARNRRIQLSPNVRLRLIGAEIAVASSSILIKLRNLSNIACGLHVRSGRVSG